MMNKSSLESGYRRQGLFMARCLTQSGLLPLEDVTRLRSRRQGGVCAAVDGGGGTKAVGFGPSECGAYGSPTGRGWSRSIAGLRACQRALTIQIARRQCSGELNALGSELGKCGTSIGTGSYLLERLQPLVSWLMLRLVWHPAVRFTLMELINDASVGLCPSFWRSGSKMSMP